MIIVKTKNGDRFINDKAVTVVKHDRENAVVNACDDKRCLLEIKDVESVIYTNDAQPTEWKDEGSEIQRLKVELEKKKKEFSQLCENYGYMREWLLIYQNALYDIKNAVFRSKNGSKCEDSVIDALIDNAEKKYKESQKRFEEVRAKTKEL